MGMTVLNYLTGKRTEIAANEGSNDERKNGTKEKMNEQKTKNKTKKRMKWRKAQRTSGKLQML